MFFVPDEEKFEEDILVLEGNLETVNYQSDYGTCMLIGIHKMRDTRDIMIPGTICGGLCYTQPIIPPDIAATDPKATIYNSSALLRQKDKEFDKAVNEKRLSFVYNWQETKLIGRPYELIGEL